MQILETLVIESEAGDFQKLAEPLPLLPVKESRIPAYRLEVDPELVIYLYVVRNGQLDEEPLPENIGHYLRSVVFITGREQAEEWRLPDFLTRQPDDREAETALVLAVFSPDEWMEHVPDYLSSQGYYLGRRSRMLFVNPEHKAHKIQVWKAAWGALLR